MKRGLLIITIFFSLINVAFAEESDMRISLHGETMENGSAYSIGMYSGGDDSIYAGLSLNYISSSKVIQYGKRKTIAPVYVFMGFKAPWRISPYIEAGFDLSDALIEEMFDELDDREDKDKDPNQIDYYFSGGLRYSLNDRLALSLYAKKYYFIFQEYAGAPINKVRPNSYGMRVIIGF